MARSKTEHHDRLSDDDDFSDVALDDADYLSLDALSHMWTTKHSSSSTSVLPIGT